MYGTGGEQFVDACFLSRLLQVRQRIPRSSRAPQIHRTPSGRINAGLLIQRIFVRQTRQVEFRFFCNAARPAKQGS